MSCDGWGVGDKCKAKADFSAVPRGAGSLPVLIPQGEDGIIEKVEDLVPHAHRVTIYWANMKLVTILEENLFENIEVFTS